MKFLFPSALVLALASMTASAGPGAFGEDRFNLILDSVDAATAAELVADRDNVEALRAELGVLRDSGADESDIESAREVLRAARGSLMTDVREIVSGNDALREDLHLAAEAAREAHRAARVEDREARYNELLSVATAEQVTTLEAQRAELDQLRGEIEAARDTGATREELAPLQAELRAARQEQRGVVREIVDANRDVLGDVFDGPRPGRHGMGRPRGQGFPGGPGFRRGGLGG